jgi:hypothetical protein
MTEQQWPAAVNAQKMIVALSGKGSERLWRLFAVACARRVEQVMRDERSRNALAVAERFADGAATTGELNAARVHAEEAARLAHYNVWIDEVRANFHWDAEQAALHAAACAADAALQCVASDIGHKPGGQVTVIAEALQLPDLLRDIFGNPFRWIPIDPLWLAVNDRAVARLAQAIYDDRAFDRLPILADALEEAGCQDADILGHCRKPAEHTRGCWVIDLLLAKE